MKGETVVKARNILFICSDQHSVFQTGCYGNEIVKTPNIDTLASEGTKFQNAYSNNPICVPARAVMATGRYSYEIGAYDNASPYTGQVPSFGHGLLSSGYEVTTIGKLHYRSPKDDVGFPDQRIPLHVRDGVGDLLGIVREPGANKPGLGNFVKSASFGDSDYIKYDAKITEEALHYLDSRRDGDRPWFLYVGYTLPHFPFISPKETWDWYDEDKLPLPKGFKDGERPEEATIKILRQYQGLDHEIPESDLRHMIHAYYGMCSYMDQQVGKVLEKLKETGMGEDTVVIYTTDHGEMLGTKGAIGKNCMYEPSARIPMIIKGPGIPAGKTCRTPVSLIDICPTVLDIAGKESSGLQGRSLIQMAEADDDMERTVFSEFHSNGSHSSSFMIRKGKYKYIYPVGHPAVLFDLDEDPDETRDISGEESLSSVVEGLHKELLRYVDPEKLNERVKAKQKKLIEDNGGLEKILYKTKPILASPPPEV